MTKPKKKNVRKGTDTTLKGVLEILQAEISTTLMVQHYRNQECTLLEV